ncbi:hypothetical protein WICPIJ_000950 [Wickerhamomyces pijperi]|uniref:Coatomer subunit zeta n=1 Tax=Wickerhamomyces pijperi TaxID=599730 RepID=A0A9P8QCH7_WICPI|nr:hypothetical protein WICPIJ_000950 [Wickerhamomyces pijperi]
MSKNLSLHAIDALLIIDNEGNRVFGKYYNVSEESELYQLTNQRTFEKSLFKKTHKQNAEILIFENRLVLYKEILDITIYIISSLEENEITLSEILGSFEDALNSLLNFTIEKKTILENYDKVVIAIDELIDDGIILESESSIIKDRTSDTPVNEIPSLKNIDLSEKGLFNAFKFGAGKLAERFGNM